MDWEKAFFITATLEMWGSIILLLILFGEIMRLIKEIRRKTRRVARIGNLVRYGVLKKLWNLIGGERYE